MKKNLPEQLFRIKKKTTPTVGRLEISLSMRSALWLDRAAPPTTTPPPPQRFSNTTPLPPRIPLLLTEIECACVGGDMKGGGGVRGV